MFSEDVLLMGTSTWDQKTQQELMSDVNNSNVDFEGRSFMLPNVEDVSCKPFR